MSVQFVGRLVACCLLILTFLVSSAAADPVTDYNVAVEFYRQQRWQLAADACEEFLKKYPSHERAASARLYYAQTLLHLKKYAEARAQFEQFLTSAPEHVDRPLAMYRVGECSSFLGDDTAVETQFGAFLKAYPKHELAEWAMLYLGEAQVRLKRYDFAVKTFEESLKAFPEGRMRDDVEFNLAGAYEALGKREQADALLAKIAERSSSTRAPEAMFQLAAREFDKKNFAAAAQTFTELATLYPQHRLAGNSWLNAGYAAYSQDQFQKASAAFAKAAAEPQLAPLATFWRGLSEKSLKNYPEAVKIFGTVREKYPDFAEADKVTFHQGDAEFRQGHFTEAIDLFASISQKWPKSEFADDGLHAGTEAALQAGELDKAVELHEKFVKEYPQSPLRPIEDLLSARVFIAKGEKAGTPEEAKADYDRAEAVLQQLLKGKPSGRTLAYATFQLARVFERRDQNEQVLATLKPLLEKSDSPEYLESRLLAANAHLRLNQPEAAAEDYQQYLNSAQSPEEKMLGYAGLARAFIAQKEWAKLPPVLKQLQETDPGDVQFSRVTLAAGDAAFDNKNWSEALGFFRMLVALGPDNPFYRPALSGLSHAAYENKEFESSAQSFEQLAQVAGMDAVLSSHASYMQGLAQQQAGNKPAALALFQAAGEKFSQANAKAPLDDEAATVGMNAFRSQQAGARVARDLGQRELSDSLYKAAYQELKSQHATGVAGLDQLLNEWANLAYAAEDYARADELYSLLVKECPESPLASEAQLILGESARFGGQRDQALKIFQKLADQTSADAFVRQRSMVHMLDMAAEAAKWNEALPLSQKLQSTFPGGPHSFYAAYREGEALLKLKEYSKAVTVLEQAKSTLPEDLKQAPVWWPEIWLMLAECHYWQKDYTQLDKTLADLRTKNPQESVLYRLDALQGRSLENRARFEEARAAYRRAIDSPAGHGTETAADCQFRIAESYLKENNLPVALREYYKVYAGYAIPKLSSAALFQAAGCDVSMKHYAEAATTYRKLLAEFPQSEFAEQAKTRLKELEPLIPQQK